MMRIASCLFLLLVSYYAVSQDLSITPEQERSSGEPDVFTHYFSDKTFRVDFLLTGKDKETIVCLWRLKEEPFWGGPHKNLTDPWNSGTYRYSVFDSATGQLLYRKGFSSLFEEYQGTPEAKIVRRAYPMTATFPYPLHPVRFEVDRRDYHTGTFQTFFTLDINPSDNMIVHEEIDRYPVVELNVKGDPSTHLDIVFLAEGYTPEELLKFQNDARRMSVYFLNTEPFSEYAGRLNFWAVPSPSAGSGIDIPGAGNYVNTNINSSFYTFGSERYLTTSDTWSMRDIAANAPYDQIVILNNSNKYGGGGFYNHYCQSTVDHEASEIVMIHEFGHAFGGLADEYVGGVNYEDFYNLKTEPWEPNITTHVDFASKWQSMIDDTIPVPTPRDSIYAHVVGMFEGGGYLAKGIYSPVMNCRMKDNHAPGFCPVCREAIRQKILYYCD